MMRRLANERDNTQNQIQEKKKGKKDEITKRLRAGDELMDEGKQKTKNIIYNEKKNRPMS